MSATITDAIQAAIDAYVAAKTNLDKVDPTYQQSLAYVRNHETNRNALVAKCDKAKQHLLDLVAKTWCP